MKNKKNSLVIILGCFYFEKASTTLLELMIYGVNSEHLGRLVYYPVQINGLGLMEYTKLPR